MDYHRRQWAQYNNYPAKTLVVAPLSVLSVWKKHFEELTDLKVRMVDPKKRGLLLKEEADVYLLHWDVLRLMPELQDHEWLHVIADECHRAQNRKAQQTKALKKIKCRFKTGLSGTPVTNTPDKLWSLLNWLYPKEYTSYWKHYHAFVEYDVIYPHGYHKITGPKNEDILQEKMAAYFVRNLKADVLKELPDKYYTEIPVDLTAPQQRAYDEMAKAMLAWVGAHQNDPVAAPIVIAQLTRLQQFADAYAEVENSRVKLSLPSSKIEALMEILEDVNGTQVAVFSQFSQMVDLVVKEFERAGYTYAKITGDIPEKLRGSVIRDFQEGKRQHFIGTIAAGGVGITLHSASTCIFLDRSWSPALNLQAEDRLHRIGQKNAVQIIDIMAKNTVDLGRQQRLEEKWTWIRKLLGDG